MNLPAYIRKNSYKSNVGTVDGSTNVFFFEVKASPEANAATLKELINSHQGEFCELDLFDGQEHNYIDLGGWIGAQDLALMLIGLGTQLGMWNLLSPRTMLGDDVPPDLEKLMAGRGFIALQAVK